MIKGIDELPTGSIPSDVAPSSQNNLIPPHPPLDAYYQRATDHAAFVRNLFNRSATQYDSANTVLSLGTGRWYRRHALRAAGLRHSMRVLDIATGTGLTAQEAMRLVGSDGFVVGIDVSEAMLALAYQMPGLLCVHSKAETLPFTGESFDFISMGYALRHVPDLAAYFRECYRVLCGGGTLVLLELGRPSSRFGALMAEWYMRILVPGLCRLRGHDTAQSLLDYYWATIEACVASDIILDSMASAGFASVRCESIAGVFNTFTGVKSPP